MTLELKRLFFRIFETDRETTGRLSSYRIWESTAYLLCTMRQRIAVEAAEDRSGYEKATAFVCSGDMNWEHAVSLIVIERDAALSTQWCLDIHQQQAVELCWECTAWNASWASSFWFVDGITRGNHRYYFTNSRYDGEYPLSTALRIKAPDSLILDLLKANASAAKVKDKADFLPIPWPSRPDTRVNLLSHSFSGPMMLHSLTTRQTFITNWCL